MEKINWNELKTSPIEGKKDLSENDPQVERKAALISNLEETPFAEANLSGMKKALRETQDINLTIGVCGIIERETDAKQAVRIILASTFGALLKKDETETAEKVAELIKKLYE